MVKKEFREDIGEKNLADLLSKRHETCTQDVSSGSPWIEGLNWMRKRIEKMSISAYNHLRVETPIENEIKAECFKEHC